MLTGLVIGGVDDAGTRGREIAGLGLEFLLAQEGGQPGGLAVDGVALFLFQGAEFLKGGGPRGVSSGGFLLTELGKSAGFALGGFLFGPEAGRFGGQACGLRFGGLPGLFRGELIGPKLGELEGGFLGVTLCLQFGETTGFVSGGGLARGFGETIAFSSCAAGGEFLLGARAVILAAAITEENPEDQCDQDESGDESFVHGR